MAPGTRLSRAALEVLTIVAYRQPCSRGEVEAIRGVNSDRLVTTLEARGLLEEAGTADGPGRAKLYRTTLRFLEHFGIASPDELPPLPEQAPLVAADPL
jgi:segregation and condensation protein B